MTPLFESQVLAQLAQGEVTSDSLVKTCLQRIADQPELGAFLEIDEEGALAQAAEIDRRRSGGETLSPIAGVPVALKDNIHVRGRRTTCASRILADFVAPFDAHVVTKLKEAGAILIGKTNMDEFAMGSSTEYSALQVTRNPHHPERVPGGSSGGSAAAVAAGLVPLALGSSTGGSIRQPAAFCGVVGMKPTYGRVSRYGLVAYGSSLDQIGPIAADVTAAFELLHVIAGHDPKDSTSAQMGRDDLSLRVADPKGLRIGIPKDWLGDGLQPEIQQAMSRLTESFAAAGAEIVEVALPHSEYAIPAYYLVATAEASSNLARFDGVRYGYRATGAQNLKEMFVKTRSEGFGPEVKRRILLGTYCLSSGYYEGYYLNAQRVRTRISDDYRQAFGKVDAILAPTTPTTAFRFGEKTADPWTMYLDDIYTVTANLAGIPAISFPAGLDSQGLPIGLQLMAAPFDESKLFQVALNAENFIRTWR
ncbi:MAG: Asp-tRNA(Asn)/Glu-tRNA(Gln) amidotransferase subunit GatA [Acidobacteria bacterium]|nr:Asp-tRNA(Asn)/Glu-tRNA(Gln) amidotransferase subunit GatA [Acidobacteriota bacterium]